MEARTRNLLINVLTLVKRWLANTCSLQYVISWFFISYQNSSMIFSKDVRKNAESLLV